MIAIVDYGMGNLRSVEKALARKGHAAQITHSPGEIAAAERVILPGVGAFGAAMGYLNAPAAEGTLGQAVRAAIAAGRPVLGICLGMQLLFTESEELGRHAGLDALPGSVVRFDFSQHPQRDELKVPHMGWNAITFPRPTPLFDGVAEGSQVYFVHSYYCRPQDDAVIAAQCHHGTTFCAAISTGNLHAVQFHPEKSGEVGLRILDNFARLS